MNRRSPPNRGSHERGALGGVEAVPFGFLVFVAGALVVLNGWLALDVHMATSAAAREGVRAAVEADPDEAAALVAQRAREAYDAYGRAGALTIDGPVYEGAGFARCARVVVTVSAEVPAVDIPFVGGVGTRTMRSSASEIVDPYRDGTMEGQC